MNLSLSQRYKLLLLFFLFLTTAIRADSLLFTPEERIWIKKNPKVLLGSDHNWPPYDFVTKKNIHTGIASDYLQLISQKSGLEFEVKSGVWADIMKQMKNSELDGLSCAMKTPKREEFLTFSTPYTNMPLAIVVQHDENNIHTLEDLKGRSVAVNKGSYLHEWLVKNHPDINLVLTTSNGDSLERVSFSNVDAYIGNMAVATYLIRENFLTNLKIVNKLDDLTTKVSVAIDKKNVILASIIEKSLNSLTKEEHKKIEAKWFQSSKLERDVNYDIDLTTAEKIWIQKNTFVKVAGEFDWAPFDFVDINKRYTGISKNYLDLISNKTGLKFEVTVDKWSANLKKIEKQEVDLIPAIYYSDERTKIVDFTSPYFEMLDYFFIRDDINATKMEDLDGKKVAIPMGYFHGEIIKKDFPFLQIIEVESFSEAVDAVLQNKADILFDKYSTIEYALKKDNISIIKPFQSYRRNDSIKLYMATAKNKPELLSIVDKALQSITTEEKEKIYKAWFKDSKSKDEMKVFLTQEEKNWIKNNPEVTYSEINWKPMSIIKNNTMVGIMNEYLEIISEHTGIKFKFKSASSWPDVIEQFKLGKIDMIPGVGASDYETKLGLTSKIYADFPFVLVTKNTQSFISDISELEGKTIAVPKYWTSYNYLREQQPNIKILEAKDIFEALNFVKDGKADAFMGHMAIGMHYVGTYYSNTLHIAGKVDYNFNHKILVQNDKQILLNIINKVLYSLSEADSLRINNKWLHVKVEKARDYTIFYQIGALLFLVIIGTIYWNRKLSHEIQLRNEIENDLKIEKDNFKVLFEKVSDGNLIIQDGKFISCNDAAVRMLGLSSKKQVLESTPFDWSPFIQEDGELSEEKALKMMQLCLENENHRFEWIHVDINNQEFWVDVGLTKITYEGKEAIYVVWRDIGEQKKLEQKLKDSESQLKVLIDKIPLQIVVSSYEGKAHMANKQTLIDYDMEGVDFSNLNVADFYADPSERDEVIEDLRTKGYLDKRIIKFRRPDGEHSMMMSIMPIKYENENMLLSISVDLTERLKMEKSLLEAKTTAEQANKSKSEFLANMSHEIRTPLNAIIGFTELLDEQITEPRLKSYVKTIQTASGTLLTLINDILDLSKIEAGKLIINNTPTNISKLCDEIVAIFTMSIKNKGLDFFLEVDSNLPKSLLIDEIRLRQILLNLIGNAVKFTQTGYVKLIVDAINIDEHHSKVDLEIRVKDTGVGIPASQLEKIFNEFEQNEGQDTRKFGGTGLGLSISKRLTNMLNGTISVESKEGNGSTFIVKLFNLDISSILEEKILEEKLSKDFSRICFDKAKVLIVDDILDNRELIINNFKETNIEIVSAVNGLDAIEVFKSEKPDLVLMDIRMPVMDGYEAALEIKKISDTPIVALTASVMLDSFETSRRENFDGFLRKPVLRNDLFSELSNFLSYKLLDETIEESVEEEELSEKARFNLSNILQILSTDIKKEQVRALESNSMTDIKLFTSSVKNLALEFDVTILDMYASKMYEAIDAFDIQVIEHLLNDFDEIVERLLKY